MQNIVSILQPISAILIVLGLLGAAGTILHTLARTWRNIPKRMISGMVAMGTAHATLALFFIVRLAAAGSWRNDFVGALDTILCSSVGFIYFLCILRYRRTLDWFIDTFSNGGPLRNDDDASG